MPFLDARAARVLATILLFGLALAFLDLAWHTLVTFLFAILFAYLLEPSVGALQARLHLSRPWAVGVLYAVLVVALGIFLFFLSPRIAHQTRRLTEVLPTLNERVANGQIIRQVGAQHGWSYQTQARLETLLADHRGTVTAIEGRLFSEVGSIASNLTWVLLVPVLAIFFLLSGGSFAQAFIAQLQRRRQRRFLEGLLSDLHEVLAKYIRAQLTLTLLALAAYIIAFEALRLPYAISLAVFAGVLEFIPVIGPLIGSLTVLATSFLLGVPSFLGLLIFLGAWRVVQDYVNSPRIMGGQVQLHPVVVLFGVFAGGEIAGVIGVYLSIPVMASLRVLWRRWQSYEMAQRILAPSGIVLPGASAPELVTPPKEAA